MNDFLSLCLVIAGFLFMIRGDVSFEKVMMLFLVASLFSISGGLREIAKQIKGDKK